MKFKIRIFDNMASLDKDIYIYHEDDNGKKHYAKPVEIEFSKTDSEEYDILPAPVFSIGREALDEAISKSTPAIAHQLLTQKSDDKDTHIKSLEKIIFGMIK